MARALNFYFSLPLNELESLVENFQKSFDELLKDSFSDEEMDQLLNKIDALAAVYVGPLLSELTIDDLDLNPAKHAEHARFFQEVRSTLTLENLPYLETNPFQVSWLQDFLSKFDRFLVESGGGKFLEDKDEFLSHLKTFKNMDSLLSPHSSPAPVVERKSSVPVLPIDFLILDVYKELERIRASGKLAATLEVVAPFEKARRLFVIMKEGRLDGESLLKLSGLSPKDFDDHLEKLKFILKKV